MTQVDSHVLDKRVPQALYPHLDSVDVTREHLFEERPQCISRLLGTSVSNKIPSVQSVETFL